MFRNAFPMCDNCIIPLSLGDQKQGVQPQLCMYFLYIQENGAISLVVLQTA